MCTYCGRARFDCVDVLWGSLRLYGVCVVWQHVCMCVCRGVRTLCRTHSACLYRVGVCAMGSREGCSQSWVPVDPVLSQELEHVRVTVLHKAVGAGLGFSLAGGADLESKLVTVSATNNHPGTPSLRYKPQTHHCSEVNIPQP